MAFIANTAHKPDLGGKVPGTNSPDATDVIQEGLLLPALRRYRGGEVNEDLKTVVMANTRTPEITWGDIQAQAQTSATTSQLTPTPPVVNANRLMI